MKNGIINNIDVDNIFASEDRKTFFVPVSINFLNFTDDIYVSCFIKRKYYSAVKKPTHLSNASNLSESIEFDQIKGSYDSLTRKQFSKNISIRSGQQESDNQKILVNKNNDESQTSTTIYIPIKETSLLKNFQRVGDNYSHIFSVYVLNKEDNVIEIVSSDQNSKNPFEYLITDIVSESILASILDQIADSVKISITPFFHRTSFHGGFIGKKLFDSGISFKYNESLKRVIENVLDTEVIGVKLECEGYFYVFPSNFNLFNNFNFLLLQQERFISGLLNKVQNLTDSRVIDFKISILYMRAAYGQFLSSEKIIPIESIKIKKLKESFYSYYKHKYFQEGNFFKVEQSGSDILITIDNEIVDSNKELYTSLSNVLLQFKVNGRTKRKLFFLKGSNKGIETNSKFLFKNIVSKSFNKLYIKQSNPVNLIISCSIPQLNLSGRNIIDSFDIYPLQIESNDSTENTNGSDPSQASEGMANHTDSGDG